MNKYSLIFLLSLFVSVVTFGKGKISNLIYVDKQVANFPFIKEVDNHTFQLISHGKPGALLLEGKWRDAYGIVSFLKEKHLITNNIQTLNVYGCHFGKGNKGSLAVSILKKELNIEIGASDNVTGFNGDWVLEIGPKQNVISLPQYNGNLQCLFNGTEAGTATIYKHWDFIGSSTNVLNGEPINSDANFNILTSTGYPTRSNANLTSHSGTGVVFPNTTSLFQDIIDPGKELIFFRFYISKVAMDCVLGTGQATRKIRFESVAHNRAQLYIDKDGNYNEASDDWKSNEVLNAGGTEYSNVFSLAATYNTNWLAATLYVVDGEFNSGIKIQYMDNAGNWNYMPNEWLYSEKSNNISCYSNTAPTLQATPSTICNGSSAELSGSGCGTGQLIWYSNAALSNQIGIGDINVSPSATHTYYAVCSKNGCNSIADSVTVTVAPLPVKPISGGNKSYCEGTIIPVLTVTVLAGQKADWYNAANNGTLLSSGSNNFTPSAAGTYYVEARNITTGCVSTDRVAVVLTQIPKPASPILGLDTVANICPSLTVNLDNLVTPVSGLNVEWHTNNNIDAVTLVSNTSAVSAGNYFCFRKNANGCYSNSSKVVVRVNPCATNDTVVLNPTCPTCAITGCVVGDDLSSLTGATFSTCGTPPGYTAVGPDENGCITYTPSPTVTGTVKTCIVACNGDVCDTTIVIINAPKNTVSPDFNATFVNEIVVGNIATNDLVIAGTQYSTPVQLNGNPNASLPVVNANGTYTFISDLPGVYQFKIRACASGQTTGCLSEILTITVIDPLNPVTPPVANPDESITKEGVPVTIAVKEDDHTTSPYGVLGNPTITSGPAHGTAIVNANGKIIYTPNSGFSGTDSFRYSICDIALVPAQCAETYVLVVVLPEESSNSTFAEDDYNSTYGTVPVSGNVLTNDSDPEGNAETVTPQTITDSTGTLTLAADGSYTFTPTLGFIGTVNHPYTVCDNANPQACAHATLHIVNDKGPDYTPSIFGDKLIFTNTDTVNDYVIAIYNINNTLNKGAVSFTIVQQAPNKIFLIDSNATTSAAVSGGYPVDNSKWNITKQGSFFIFTLKPGVIIPANGAVYIGIKTLVGPLAPIAVFSFTATIKAQSGGDSNFNNNGSTIRLLKD